MNSIIPGDNPDICYECHRFLQPYDRHQHHIFSGSYRDESERFGLKIYLCPLCHTMIHHAKGKAMREEYQKIAQTEFMEMMMQEGLSEGEALDEFRKHFNKSRL